MSTLPTPRIGVSDAALTRPDWTTQSPRPEGALWLDRNENLDPVLAKITAGILTGLKPSALYTYPDLSGLYVKLAEVMGVKAEQLVLAAGSDGAIRTVYEAYISPGDIVIHSEPTFAMYSVYACMYAADARPFKYQPGPNGPVLEVEQLIAQIAELKPRMVALPNPDSPTGTVVEQEALRRIVEAAGDAGAVMLVDEAYYPFYPHSVADWVETNRHLVVTRTFGKAWGLAGTRVGFAVAHPEMAEILHKVRPMYEIGALSANLVELALDCADDVQASVERILDGKRWFAAEMEAMGYPVLAGHGNFIHVHFGTYGEAIHRALDGRVLYRRDFPNTALAGYSRFTAGPKEVLEPVVEWINSAVIKGVV